LRQRGRKTSARILGVQPSWAAGLAHAKRIAGQVGEAIDGAACVRWNIVATMLAHPAVWMQTRLSDKDKAIR